MLKCAIGPAEHTLVVCVDMGTKMTKVSYMFCEHGTRPSHKNVLSICEWPNSETLVSGTNSQHPETGVPTRMLLSLKPGEFAAWEKHNCGDTKTAGFTEDTGDEGSDSDTDSEEPSKRRSKKVRKKRHVTGTVSHEAESGLGNRVSEIRSISRRFLLTVLVKHLRKRNPYEWGYQIDMDVEKPLHTVLLSEPKLILFGAEALKTGCEVTKQHAEEARSKVEILKKGKIIRGTADVPYVYLAPVMRYAMSIVQEDILHTRDMPVTVVITHPAQWDWAARSKRLAIPIRKVFVSLGYSPDSLTICFLEEPVAAATYVLEVLGKNIPVSGFIPHPVLSLCGLIDLMRWQVGTQLGVSDAGGGTVDHSIFRMKSHDPFEWEGPLCPPTSKYRIE